MSESYFLELQAELRDVYQTIAGMEAENIYRESRREKRAYDKKSFFKLAIKAHDLRERIKGITGVYP